MAQKPGPACISANKKLIPEGRKSATIEPSAYKQIGNGPHP